MRREQPESCLSAVFVDYDNIYLSLKRKSEEAARRFAKNAALWIKEIEQGRLITPTNGPAQDFTRRIVMNHCYGNPVPRRNAQSNSTDMNSFPFVRHHFQRAGFEIIDCPPLTAQLKNSSDIRMVMDILDFLTHDTYFDEFIILSGDADFTPALHRLRNHARRTVIFANDHTVVPYTAICDGEVQEADLISLLLDGRMSEKAENRPVAVATPSAKEQAAQADDIIAEVVKVVRAAETPVPIEALADRAQRALGHERTIGTNWAGHGAFRSFLLENLPEDIQLTAQAPYFAVDLVRHQSPDAQAQLQPPVQSAVQSERTARGPAAATTAGDSRSRRPAKQMPATPAFQAEPHDANVQPAVEENEGVAGDPQPLPQSSLQESIGRIHEACQAPPLGPPEYRLLFEVIATELTENGLAGPQTPDNIVARAEQARLSIKRDDVRFVLDVVSEADPWFEQGASANLFAGRFRNFVVARCRGQGLNLSADELDLIDAWFAGGGAAPQIAHQPGEPMPALHAEGEGMGVGVGAPAHPDPVHPDPVYPDPVYPGNDRVEAQAGHWTGAEPQPRSYQDPAASARPIAPARAVLGTHPDAGFDDVGQMPRFVRSRTRG